MLNLYVSSTMPMTKSIAKQRVNLIKKVQDPRGGDLRQSV